MSVGPRILHVTYSNRTEALLARLVARLDARRRRGDDPLAPVWIVVPNKNVERYVELGIARGLGIAANLQFVRLSGLASAWLGERILLGAPLVARVLAALLDDALVETAALAPVRRYLAGAGEDLDAVELRRVQLAVHLAHLLEEYAFSRPELLEAWDAGHLRFARGDRGVAARGLRPRARRPRERGVALAPRGGRSPRRGRRPPKRSTSSGSRTSRRSSRSSSPSSVGGSVRGSASVARSASTRSTRARSSGRISRRAASCGAAGLRAPPSRSGRSSRRKTPSTSPSRPSVTPPREPSQPPRSLSLLADILILGHGRRNGLHHASSLDRLLALCAGYTLCGLHPTARHPQPALTVDRTDDFRAGTESRSGARRGAR